jgi:competence protein ComEC
LLEITHQADARPRGVLRITAIDVGQGDSVLIDLPDGAAMLVDAGGGSPGSPDPGARVVVPFLADRRRRDLAIVVASHPHPDHVAGLRAVLRWAHVSELWDTRQVESLGSPSAAWLAMRTEVARAGIRLRGPESVCNGERPFHGARLQVLAPCPAVDRSDRPNDASFGIRIAYGRGSVLLRGDLEARGEARVMPQLAGRPVTVLKVPHHGSRTSSTPGFLDVVRPRVALVSAGHPSPFDHPHPEVLERLRARGVTVLDTSSYGAISATIRADGSVTTAWGRSLGER